MKMLEDRIRKDGIVREGNVLKVDSFINHQMDIPLFREMAREWKRLFAGKPINKVLTIERHRHCGCGSQRAERAGGVCQKIHEHQSGLRQLQDPDPVLHP